jgi:Zn-dependent alcohol dehydrogenase
MREVVIEVRGSDPVNVINKPRDVSVHVIRTYHPAPQHCPFCQTGKMEVKQNSHTGRHFLGCTNFPTCRYTQTMI